MNIQSLITIKCLEENIENLCHIELGKEFLYVNQKLKP